MESSIAERLPAGLRDEPVSGILRSLTAGAIRTSAAELHSIFFNWRCWARTVTIPMQGWSVRTAEPTLKCRWSYSAIDRVTTKREGSPYDFRQTKEHCGLAMQSWRAVRLRREDPSGRVLRTEELASVSGYTGDDRDELKRLCLSQMPIWSCGRSVTRRTSEAR